MASKPSDYLDIISSPQAEEPVRLASGQQQRSVLQSVIEPDGEDFVLACFAERIIEVPKNLAPELRELVGQKTLVALIDGKHRVGWSST